jgi:hypothetical protein
MSPAGADVRACTEREASVPIEPGDSASGRELGRRSGQRRRRLVLADVERDLPPLDSAEHAQQRLARISNWGLAGMLSASQVGAQERVHREWREQHAFEIDRQRVQALERRIAQLERELAQRPRLGRVP